ncbi:LytTR family DNA-binding domain-containing protein [soil metagenome]
MSISVILIDDEPLAIADLRSMLKSFEQIEIVSEASNASMALVEIEKHRPDLIFLDINMPDKSGFDLLEELNESPEVIFVTAYDQFAIKAFEVNALDYLMKPVNPDRLKEAVEKVQKKIYSQGTARELTMEKRIFIKDGEQCHFVPLSEVFLIESVGNYARVFYRNEKPLLHKSLNYLDERLPGEFFFRASRQFILNTNYIKNIAPYFNSTLQVELQNGAKIDISQRQSVKFKEMMGI